LSAEKVPAPRVTVVIPNWNGLSHLEQCFESLDAQTLRDFEVVFVDNASADRSVEWVRTNHPAVRVVERPDNGGFAKAVNVGILASASEYVALLNNDTLADPDWLFELVRALDGAPCYDAAASRMMLYDRPDLVNAAGDTYSIVRVSGRNRGLGRPTAGYLERCRVLGACAGAALYRRSIFEVVGLFDEDFFLLHEDTDFNLRALVAGKRCLYVPEAVVVHKHHGSLDRQPAKRLELLQWRNRAATVAKSAPMVLWPVLEAFWLLSRTWWTLRGPWSQRLGMAREISEAVRQGRRDGKAKRAAVMATKAVSTCTVLRWLVRGTGRYEECSSS